MQQSLDFQSLPGPGSGSRSWLRALGVAASAISLGSLADGGYGRHRWPTAQTRLIGLEPGVKRAVLAFGGLGSVAVAQHAAEIQQLMPGESIAYWEYSTSRVSIDEMAELLHDQGRDLETVSLNGHSMGGLVGLEVLRRSRIEGLKLGRVLLHCSPFDLHDVRHRRATVLAEIVRWPTGPASKFTFSFTRSLLERESIGAAWQRAKFDALHGSAPEQFTSMLRILRHTSLTPFLPEYRRMVGPETCIEYFMPENPARDKVVDTEQAARRLEKDFAEPIGAPFTVHRVPNAAHAEVEKACRFLLTIAAASSGRAFPAES